MLRGKFFFFHFYFILLNFIYLFIYFWLCWVFAAACGLSPVAASGATLHCGAWASHCGGLSRCRARALGAWASAVVARRPQRTGSAVVACMLSCSAACGILPAQGSNLCPLGAGARARRARGGRRTGARGPAAWWGARLSCGAGGELRGGMRPGRGGGGPGAAAWREAGAAALARAPPPPSLPQRLPPSPGAAAAPAPWPGRPGCRRSGRSRRAALCREDSGSGTHCGLRLPRAPVHCLQGNLYCKMPILD